VWGKGKLLESLKTLVECSRKTFYDNFCRISVGKFTEVSEFLSMIPRRSFGKSTFEEVSCVESNKRRKTFLFDSCRSFHG
jgi:hypothetical protein